MLDKTTEALEIIRKIMARDDLKSQHKTLLMMPPQYSSYYNPNRMYNDGEVCWVEKTTLAEFGIIESDSKYNKELVKFVSQKEQTETTTLDDRTQFRSYQNYEELSYWLKDERCLTGCRRISIENDKIYIATVDIPRADKDPSLVTDEKWKLENSEIEI